MDSARLRSLTPRQEQARGKWPRIAGAETCRRALGLMVHLFFRAKASGGRIKRNIDRLFSDRISKVIKGTITHVNTSEPAIALTFDDGPDPIYTPRLLDVLDVHKVRATFFMVGALAARHPVLVAEVARRGHAIGSHGWNHASFPSVGRFERWRQLRACHKVLHPYAHKLFRPPKGSQTLSSWLDASLLGYRVVTWNIGARDWLDSDPQWMLQHIGERIAPGCIILLHDGLCDPVWEGASDRSVMLETVDRLLEQTAAQYRYLTVPELLERGSANREAWLR